MVVNLWFDMDALENLFRARIFQLAVTQNPGLKRSVCAAQRMVANLSNAKHARAALSMAVRIIQTAISLPGKDLSNSLVQSVVVYSSLQVNVKPNVQIARKPSSWKILFLKLLNRRNYAFCTFAIFGSRLRQFLNPIADCCITGSWYCCTRFMGNDQKMVR